jgi:hypothetical protein
MDIGDQQVTKPRGYILRLILGVLIIYSRAFPCVGVVDLGYHTRRASIN